MKYRARVKEGAITHQIFSCIIFNLRTTLIYIHKEEYYNQNWNLTLERW